MRNLFPGFKPSGKIFVTAAAQPPQESRLPHHRRTLPWPLGIGANSTIFSVINALLYRPLPYEHADRLVVIWEMQLSHPDSWQPPPIAELLDWKSQNHVFEDIALTSSTEPAVLSGERRPPADPRTGRHFPISSACLEQKTGFWAEFIMLKRCRMWFKAVVISSSFLEDAISIANPAVSRQDLQTLVASSPQWSELCLRGSHPFYGGRDRPMATDQFRQAGDTRNARIIGSCPVARLKPGVTLEQAKNEMNVIASRPRASVSGDKQRRRQEACAFA